MLEITNDPIPLLLDVVEELYPGTNALIQFDPTIKPEEKECGFATYSDEIQNFVISVSTEIPIYAAVEIIAHEAAHVIAGLDEEHGDKWEAVFAAIHQRYCARVVEEAKSKDADVYGTDGSTISEEAQAAVTKQQP